MKDSFRQLLQDIKNVSEEVTSGDIATVDTKIGTKREHGKKCKTHKRHNCLDCQKD